MQARSFSRGYCAHTWQTGLAMESAATRTVSSRQTRLAQVQFALALGWLSCLALVLHLHQRPEDRGVFYLSVAGLGVLYLPFWTEWALRRGGARSRTLTWCGILPILRIGLRDPAAGDRIWLPLLGWRIADERLVKDVDRALSTPMLLISLAVLPVVLVEFTLAEKLEANPRLAQLTALATAIIWWSFTVEFVLMVSLTSKKLDYCKRHWLDLAIILLPLLYFLRALRLGRLLRLQSLSKTARMYKLRGVVMRTYRALLVIEAIRRLLHGSPQKRLERLRRQLADHEAALEQMRAEVCELEAQLATESAATPAADQAAA